MAKVFEITDIRVDRAAGTLQPAAQLPTRRIRGPAS